MAVLPLEQGAENPILRAESVKVKATDKVDGKPMGKFLDDMRDTMIKAPGVGLAAPQVSQNVCVVICHFNHDTDHETIVEMINPEITSKSEEMVTADEGCLSLPKKFASVARHKSLTVKYFDRKGKEHVLQFTGWNARIVQHEVDHINGTLYIDRVVK